MAYNPNVPDPASQRFKDSQPLILGNFQDIGTGFNLNHVAFNNGVDTGKHKFLQMPVQASAPTTNATEMGLYTKTSTRTLQPEMFVRRQTNGTEIEFTGCLAATNGWTILPSGILLKWGQQAIAATPQVITYPVAATIPVFSSVFMVDLSFETSNVNVTAYATIFNSNINSFSCAITANGGPVTVLTAHYLAVGVP